MIRLIKEQGSCHWSDVITCTLCPMSKLKMHPDGTRWLSCMEAVGAHTAPDMDSANALYKKIAESLLLDIEVDNMLNQGNSE